MGRGRDVLERTRHGVGASAPRIDGVPKVRGSFAYGSDLWHEHMLWGTTLRSPYPHARIRSIDISKAVASPGVHAVLLASDVPGKRMYGLDFADQPVLAEDRVRYHGEPVAVVAAERPVLARRAGARVLDEPSPAMDVLVVGSGSPLQVAGSVGGGKVLETLALQERGVPVTFMSGAQFRRLVGWE
jgi:xanthine dehydrogenase molybdopterin-binding subunit B